MDGRQSKQSTNQRGFISVNKEEPLLADRMAVCAGGGGSKVSE